MNRDPRKFFSHPFDIVPADKSGCGIPLLTIVALGAGILSMLHLH